MLKAAVMSVWVFVLVKLWSFGCFHENTINAAVETPRRRLRGMVSSADSAGTWSSVTFGISPQTTGSNSLRGSVATLPPLSLPAIVPDLEDHRTTDPVDDHSGAASFVGHMRMEVPDPRAFLSDTDARSAVIEGISHLLDIRSEYISLEVSWSGSMLMMSSDDLARHVDRSVDIDYFVQLQAHHVMSPMSLVYMVNSQPVAEISSTIQKELIGIKGDGYIANVLEHKMTLQ